MSLEAPVRHFACTQCGKCCNRSPEVELSEAAALADVFVFRLMFRLYWLPDQAGDSGGNSKTAFFEKKRLLSAFAARRYPAKVRRDGKRIAYSKYLVVSALALDTSPGACSALEGTRCGIHDRRPLSCRSVPLHYSRAEALAQSDLDAFVATDGYRCDTGDDAPVILSGGRIADPEINAARVEAVEHARRDRRWSEAIVRRMGCGSLPSLGEIETNAQLGAITTSMRIAWQIAAETGLITSGECARLVELQRQVIRRELALGRCSKDARETLTEMEAEYAAAPILAAMVPSAQPEC